MIPYIVLGTGTFLVLSVLWAYIAFTRHWVCPLMADSLLNGAILLGIFSAMLFSNRLDLVNAENRAAINILFSLYACVVQVLILFAHRNYHRMVGSIEPS